MNLNKMKTTMNQPLNWKWIRPISKGANLCLALNGFVVVDLLLIVTPIVGFCNCSMFCCRLLYVHSSFAIILMGKRELVALLSMSSWCLVIVVWLFLAVP